MSMGTRVKLVLFCSKTRLPPASSFDFVDRGFDGFAETHELISLG